MKQFLQVLTSINCIRILVVTLVVLLIWFDSKAQVLKQIRNIPKYESGLFLKNENISSTYRSQTYLPRHYYNNPLKWYSLFYNHGLRQKIHLNAILSLDEKYSLNDNKTVRNFSISNILGDNYFFIKNPHPKVNDYIFKDLYNNNLANFSMLLSFNSQKDPKELNLGAGIQLQYLQYNLYLQEFKGQVTDLENKYDTPFPFWILQDILWRIYSRNYSL